VYKLAASLPDAPLSRFIKETAILPQTTEAERLVVQRIGQSVFRDALIDYWTGCCPLTGITTRELLRASHIIPWSECDDKEPTERPQRPPPLGVVGRRIRQRSC
jgi:hypothetical protein